MTAQLQAAESTVSSERAAAAESASALLAAQSDLQRHRDSVSQLTKERDELAAEVGCVRDLLDCGHGSC